jgi:hypothetical protein
MTRLIPPSAARTGAVAGLPAARSPWARFRPHGHNVSATCR